jgi:hypothetical protein
MKQQEREKAVRTERMQQANPAQKNLMNQLGHMKFQVPAGGKSIRQTNFRSQEHTNENSTQELKPEIMLGKQQVQSKRKSKCLPTESQASLVEHLKFTASQQSFGLNQLMKQNMTNAN